MNTPEYVEEKKQEYQMPCPYGIDDASKNMDRVSRLLIDGKGSDKTLKLTDEEFQEFNDNWEKHKNDPMQFIKHDSGKLRYGLIPPLAEAEMVKVLTFGAEKYSADNWRNVDDLSRYVDAALRHVAAYRMGERWDRESFAHHLAHAMCCLSFIVDIEIGNTDTVEDRA